MSLLLTRVGTTRVYAEQSPPAGEGLLAFLVCHEPATWPPQLPIATAWRDADYAGWFVMLPTVPASLETFAQALQDSQILPTPTQSSFAWLRYNDASQAFTIVQQIAIAPALAPANDPTIAAHTPIAFRNYGFTLWTGAPVVLVPGTATSAEAFVFQYPPTKGFPIATLDGPRLPIDKANRFAFHGEGLIGDFSDARETGWDVACRFYAKGSDGKLRFWRYPIFTNPSGGRQYLFNARWDLLRPLDGDRTCLEFTTKAFELTIGIGPEPSSIAPVETGGWFTSLFRSRYGRVIELKPFPPTSSTLQPKLVFQSVPDANGDETRYNLVPAGDFLVRLGELPKPAWPDAIDTPTQHQLLCGLAGTEFIELDATGAQPQALLRFHPDRPAFAPRYPIFGTGAAAVRARAAAGDALLTSIYKTAWVSLSAPPPQIAPLYFSQPQKAPLFRELPQSPAQGRMDPPNAPTLLQVFEPSVAPLDFADIFPMAGFGASGAKPSPGTEPPSEMTQFETQIIAPTRFQQIVTPATLARVRALPQGEVDATTPQGLRALIDGPAWKTVFLAETADFTGPSQLAFHDLPPALIAALQSTDLFLVISNKKKVGTFDGRVVLDGWPFTVNLSDGTEQVFANILVLKFGTGTIKDRARDVSSWTQAGDFNTDPNLLSQWISSYIADAELLAPDEPSLRMFVELVNNEHWNGVLALRLDIDLRAFPDELKGLLGGMDLSRFYGHHIGVLQNRPTEDEQEDQHSSLFGLILYRDAGGNPGQSAAAPPGPPADNAPPPITPDVQDFMGRTIRAAARAAAASEDSGASYNYRVITLIVTFRNALIDDFESRIILTILKLFGRPAMLTDTSSDSAFRNSIVFDSSFQRINGRPSYSFTSSDRYRFETTSNIVNYAEFVSAQFATVRDQAESLPLRLLQARRAMAPNAPDTGTLIRARFQLSGFLNFHDLFALDAFSFGSEPMDDAPAAAAAPAEGLRFLNLAIAMSFFLEAPTELTFELDSTAMSFDTSLSKARPISVFAKMPLTLSQLIVGRADQAATDLGYVSVDTPTLEGSHTLTTEWYGLVYMLNLGSLGALAEHAGLSAQLMAAWSPAETSPAAVWLNLPGLGGGKKGISLQSVLRLTVADIQLTTEVNDQNEVVGYLLKLRDIGLTFLGKKLPPSGITDVALFGSQSATEGNSSLSWYAVYYTSSPPADV